MATSLRHPALAVNSGFPSPIRALLLAVPLTLAACGGGDSGTDPVGSPSGFSVGYDTKAYQFSWSASPNATRYELFEDPDGASGPQAEVQIGGSLNGTTYAHTLAALPLHERVNASYRLRACDAAGCGPFTAALTPDLTRAIGYFKASHSSRGSFGSAVALSGDGTTMAVAAINERSNATGINGDQTNDTLDNSGAVYVFSRSSPGSAWSQQAYIKASNNRAFSRNGYLAHGPYFGFSLALSANGSTLAVGSPYESSNARGVNGSQDNADTPGAGAVYVFTRSNASWSQQAYIKASNTRAQADYYFPDGSDGAYRDVLNPAMFGAKVALSGSGDMLAVGAPGEGSAASGVNGNQESNSAPNAGAVYTYARSGATWTHQAYLKASNTDAGDGFGSNIALSADASTLTASAPAEASRSTGINGDQSDNTLPGSGAVYVFTQHSGSWSQQAYLKAGNADVNEAFAGAQALSSDGNTLAIAGNAVNVFVRSSGAWSQQARLTSMSSGVQYAPSVALSADGNVLAVGTPADGSHAVGLQGSPASNDKPRSGAVSVFQRSNGAWQTRAYVKASNPDAHDQFGGSVALSADASTMAVGAADEQSKATGVQGNQADNSGPPALPGWGYASNYGAVYLY